MARSRVVCVVGTRPDAIKMMPVLLELQAQPNNFEPILVSTGQHRDLLNGVFETFRVTPDLDLKLASNDHTLSEILCQCLGGLDWAFAGLKPDFVLGQGDTTTTLAASMASFFHKIPFGHIEAGLRSCSIDEPFPEEFNRRATSLIAAQHYAPTAVNAQKLAEEGVSTERIFVTGNPVIDAVRIISDKPSVPWYAATSDRIVLLTAHRRENWGEPMEQICQAARRLVDSFEDVRLVVSMHPNPVVKGIILSHLAGHPRIDLIDPPSYERFIKLLQRAHLVITDSGGIQEEAPFLGVPVLVTRRITERTEVIESGSALQVGTDAEVIYANASKLLSDKAHHKAMATPHSPYGDGFASKRIVDALGTYLG